MAERFDDVCELGKLSGGDDVGKQVYWIYVQNQVFKGLGINKVTIYSSQPPLLSTIILMKMDFNSTPPGFHYEFKGVFFTDLNIFYQTRLEGLTL